MLKIGADSRILNYKHGWWYDWISECLSIAFGMINNDRINAICAILGELWSHSLRVFLAFSDCDTTSTVNGMWQEISLGICRYHLPISGQPFQKLHLHSAELHTLERLTVILYDNTSLLLWDNTGSFVPNESINKQTDIHPGCTSSAFPTCSDISWKIGRPAHRHTRRSIRQKKFHGPRCRIHGRQSGRPFQKNTEHAESW